ncbi:LacI family DNA-binding transcriptional regulator [Salisediminibacterium selenitireducens]|uniref:Transcriptional regulator, LacI family n=1 Tax=Bacillus selenitireducens (strain ATCC 700615 / DSM 15326 / MLS10) TaxID=439292 RepID=D6XXI3_BACIE|nr:LacI family DNA-binding transcriptional regulator [Salisediminibacterium selenitireducens]ADH98040.1 transcriptional regulator, LacI family [[Bacillus] selenitireducens MLS10]
MVTINDIARQAGVSRTTVSRVLNQNGYVSDRAKTKVLEVIEETGYVPSEQAKSLRTKKTNVIGVILPRLSSETVSRVVDGMDRELAKAGYQILLSSTSLETEKEADHIRLLESRRVDGIVLFGTHKDEAILNAIKQAKVPVVVLGQDFTPHVSSVVYNDYEASRAAVAALADVGHEKIGFIGVDEADIAVGQERRRGYLDEMKSRGFAVLPEWMQTAGFDMASGSEAFQKMLEYSQTRPTAVFAVTDRLAIGAMQRAKDAGMSVPGEMAFISIGASEASQVVTPKLATVDYYNEDAGMSIASLILEEIDEDMKDAKKIVMNYGLLLRDSLC